mmetsp:Transcript_38594/g.50590  ORF Transcript_38594/g.50590 Transcript_38594/m.50590 type:complete len:194 (+) Transcript_38594:427-1008(+)
MQRLILLFNYHELVMEEEDDHVENAFPSADLTDYLVAQSHAHGMNPSQRHSGSGAGASTSTGTKEKVHSASSSGKGSHHKRGGGFIRPQPLHLQLQKYLRKVFARSEGVRERLQEIFVQFSEIVLFLTLDESRESFRELYKVYCAFPPSVKDSPFQKGLAGLAPEEVADADFKSTSQLISPVPTKFARLETVL